MSVGVPAINVAVVVVGFGEEPQLRECLESVLADLAAGDEVVLVDNGITTPVDVAGVRVVTAPSNLGYAAGCELGVGATTAPALVFLNSDALLRPGSVAALAAALGDHSIGMVTGSVRFANDPHLVNAAGNPVHVSGLSWSGGFKDAATLHARGRDVASVSGALFAMRRATWELLGGLDPTYFLYHEDVDLSLRCWASGLRVTYCPDAVALHAYEFARNPRKMFLLERNRLVTVLTDFPTSLLLRAAPLLAMVEAMVVVVSIRDGWFREKVRSWAWLARRMPQLAARRRKVMASVTHPELLADVLSPRLSQSQLKQPAALILVNGLMATYWAWARPKQKSFKGIGRPDVVVLRSNPKDSSLPRLLNILIPNHRTTALVWDRDGDYVCPRVSSVLTVDRNTTPGRYHHPSTLLGILRLQPWLLRRLLSTRPRVIHAMDLDTGVIGLVAARLLRARFVYQCLDPYAGALPDGWPPFVARAVNRIENAVISRADLFVITDLKRLPQHAGSRPREVAELPNVPMIEVRHGEWTVDGLVVGYVGSLVPHRSLDLIVDTIGALEDEGIRLVIGGYGPLSDDLRRRCGRYSNITFLGWVDDADLMGIMATFDVFVQIEDPSHAAYRWVSPNKVFESMAFGRPIIVAKGTLAAERVQEAGHGLTVTYGVDTELRRTLLELKDDRRRLQVLGAAGAESHARHWTPAAVTDRFATAYRDLCTEDASVDRAAR